MKLYICDEEKISKYNLPEEVRESFLIQYSPSNSKKSFDISIESNEKDWTLKSNGVVNFIENGRIMQSVILSNYYSCNIQLSSDNLERTLYCVPHYDEKYTDFSTYGLENILIGSGSNNNICFNSNYLVDNHIVIQNVNNLYYLKTNYNNVYVNDLAVKQVELKCGDIIFTSGLRIIFMGNFLRVNNPLNNLVVNGMQDYSSFSNNKYSDYNKNDTSTNSVDLYDSDKLFYHIPRIISGFDVERVSIDPPPQEEKETHTPIIIALGSSVTMAASSFIMGFNVINTMSNPDAKPMSYIPQIIMCIAMIFGSVIMPKITSVYNNKLKRKAEKLRQEKYGAYLQNKENFINQILEKQSNIIKYNYPSMNDLYKLINQMDRRLWERQLSDEDFLTLALGNGNRKSKIEVELPEKGFEMEEDALKNKAYEIANKAKYLNNVPFSYSLIEKKLSAIIIKNTYKREYINYLILQLASLHSSVDLKLVFLVNNTELYDFCKYLPHAWSEDKKNRLYGSTLSEMKQVCEILEKENKERIASLSSKGNADKLTENDYKNFNSYYLIISDSYKKIKDIPFINDLVHNKYNIGFSILFLENKMTNLPPECSTLSFIDDKESYLIEPGENYSLTHNFTLPELINIDMRAISYKLLNIPTAAKEGTAILPKSLTFLEMYKVSKIEQLNILNRWKANNPVQALNTPIGVHSDGELFMLNLHEKAHGPHGLIAGSTGSGKSEFIITFVLSMAINFHPYEVQFVLIDYKGGGLAGAFENRETGISLPHLAGTITNLDTAEMNRTLVSINSELKRRQAKFNEEREKLGESTMDIYKYQKLYREGKIKDPMSHLFLISDEFAELKSQQPEFLNELISTARIGRSLGVHLILATQKPSGVVNDQIWSNSKFKICLKVQDRSDSMEMIKKPDAASIKETGRFYLQVGFDEYFDIGQSGYSGAEYIPSNKVMKDQDMSVTLIDSIGNTLSTYEDDVEEDENEQKLGDQLTNIVKYIVSISKEEKIKTSKLWLSSIPDVIQLNGLIDKYDFESEEYEINIPLGEYDNPAAQIQGLLTVDLTNTGHLLVFGMAGSGKENLLTTLIYNTCVNHSPEEVNMYIFDYGAEILKIFSKYPQVGSVTTIDENDGILDTLLLIDEESDRRKSLFVEYGGTYKNYIKESGKKLPLIIIVINYYEVFAENNGRLMEPLQNMMRDGSKYGIIFVVTTSVNNSINQRVQQLFMNKIILQQPDDGIYRTTFNAPRGLTPKRFFGRGLASKDNTYYEFQTAYICEKEGVNKLIRKTSAELNEKYKTRAKTGKKLPETVSVDSYIEKSSSINSIPLGLSKDTVDTYNFDLSKAHCLPMITNDILGYKSFVTSFVKLIKNIPSTEIQVLDALNILDSNINDIEVTKGNFLYKLSEMIQGFNKESSDDITRVYFIIGLTKMKEQIDSNYIKYFESLMENINKFNNSKIIIYDSYENFAMLQNESWFNIAINPNTSIWLGNDCNTQDILKYKDVDPEDFKDKAVVSIDGEITVIKTVSESVEV